VRGLGGRPARDAGRPSPIRTTASSLDSLSRLNRSTVGSGKDGSLAGELLIEAPNVVDDGELAPESRRPCARRCRKLASADLPDEAQLVRLEANLVALHVHALQGLLGPPANDLHSPRQPPLRDQGRCSALGPAFAVDLAPPGAGREIAPL